MIILSLIHIYFLLIITLANIPDKRSLNAILSQHLSLGIINKKPLRNVMAVPMGEITRALVGVRRRLCVKWGFVDMDVYEQEYLSLIHI